MTKLSVLIPTYNRKKSLEKTLPTFLANKSSDIEFIFVDNNSNDGTEKFLLTEAKKDGRIKYFKNSVNIGPNRNVYRAYLESSFDWIMMLSDRDFLKGDFIKELLNIIEKNKDCGLIINAFEHGPLIFDKTTRIKKGFLAIKTAFTNSGFFSYLVFNKLLIDQKKWLLDDFIYPQVRLAVEAALNYDVVFFVAKNLPVQGIRKDYIEKLVRPNDFGIFERTKILLDISKRVNTKKRLDLINSLSITLFYWGIAVSKEIYLINKKKGLSFIRNLLRNPFIKSSSIFMGILVDQYIFGKDVFLKDKAKIFFYILSSFFFSLLKKNMYQSFYYIIRNIKKLRNKKRLNNKAENLLKK